MIVRIYNQISVFFFFLYIAKIKYSSLCNILTCYTCFGKYVQKSAVHVQDVVYKNIKGTSFTEAAIKLDCSKNHKCRGIVLQNIDLVTIKGKKTAKAECKNVKLFHRGKVSPGCSHET